MAKLKKKIDVLKCIQKQFCRLDELFVKYIFDKKRKDLSFLELPVNSIIQNYDFYDYLNSDFEFHCLIKSYYYRLVAISRNIHSNPKSCVQTQGKILNIIRNSIKELDEIIFKTK